MIDYINFESIEVRNKSVITIVKSEKVYDYIHITFHVFGFGIGSFKTKVKFIPYTITDEQLANEVMSTIFGVQDNHIKDDTKQKTRENLLLSITIGYSFWVD